MEYECRKLEVLNILIERNPLIRENECRDRESKTMTATNSHNSHTRRNQIIVSVITKRTY